METDDLWNAMLLWQEISAKAKAQSHYLTRIMKTHMKIHCKCCYLTLTITHSH